MGDGIPLITALHIQANETKVEVFKDEKGKYGFELYSIIREKYRPHITSSPVYDSAKEARSDGESLLREIQSLDLTDKRKEISDILGDSAEDIQKVVDASKSER